MSNILLNSPLLRRNYLSLFIIFISLTLSACGGSSENSPDNNESPNAVANGPYTAITNNAVQFSSAGSDDPDGEIDSYSWNFGDGSSSDKANPSHSYASADSYTVTLTVTDNDGDSDSDSASVSITDPTSGNQNPTAEANGPYSGTSGIAVSLSSAGSDDIDGSIASFAWDFGDGNSSTEENPAHIYVSAGNYNVSLTVTDDDGASDQDLTTVAISNPGTGNLTPVANANGPYISTTGIVVIFSSAGSADSDGSIASYSWDFGDGSSSSAANPTHTYSAAGSYNISLTVTDNDGASSPASTTIATITDQNVTPIANANGPYSGLTS